MKVVHLNKERNETPGLADEAKELESIVRKDPNEKAINRLLLIYRKLKEPEKELRVINSAIRIFETRLKERQPVFNKKITALSKALRKATGLADQKGNNLYEPGELAKWRRRKEILVKKKKPKQSKTK